MKNINLFVTFFIMLIQISIAKEFTCPDKFDVHFQNEKHSDFEVFPNKMNYLLASALLYSGHPKEMAALKGHSQSRSLKDRPFWLVCNYKMSERIHSNYKFAKKIPVDYTNCKYSEGFKSIVCEQDM